jgi:23S rRNA pseudouridine2605 synthase
MQERLQKLIAQAGITSRRKAEKLIADGQVTVNGKVVTEMGTKADIETDHIKVSGKLINPILEKREKVYLLLNKPKGVLSSIADPENRKLVSDLIPERYGRVFPVGRLDFNTEGLIIMTNDGNFSNRVASTRTIAKVYEVKVKGLPNENAINKLRRGIRLDDGFKTAPAHIKEKGTTGKNAWFEVTLYEGHNQQIRKMFDAVGFSVVKLRRTNIGHIDDKNIRIGDFRELTEKEIKDFTPKKVATK